MATTLRSRITFTAVAGGATSAPLPHFINVVGVPHIPDRIEVDNPNFSVGPVTSTTVVVTNNGATPGTVNVLCEYWHTIDRVFGSNATFLTSPPFIVAGAGSTAAVPPVTPAWLLAGNPGTTPGVNFVGTTDPVDLVLSRSSAETARLTATAVALPIGKALEIYNVGTPGAVNFERGSINWNLNVFTVTAQQGGTGVARQLDLLQGDGTGWRLQGSGINAIVGTASGQGRVTVFADDTGLALLGKITTSVTIPSVEALNNPSGTTFSAAAGVQRMMAVTAVTNQTGTAGFINLESNTTPTSVGSGTVLGLSVKRTGVQVFAIDVKATLTADGDTVMFLTYFSAATVKHARVTLGVDVGGFRALRVAT